MSNGYEPPIGSNAHDTRDDLDTAPRYEADVDHLRSQLEVLLFELGRFENELEGDMFVSYLKVDPDDNRLIESHHKEWPRGLGEPGDRISYRYYKALRLRNTTSASYIRKRFEEAARDVGGTIALDMLALTSVMKDEALLIQEFLNAYIGTVDDSSEHRTVEIFEDWVQTALGHTRQLRSLFQTGEAATELLSQPEIERTTPEAAKQSQAVFKVKLNSYNGEVVKNTEFLKKNFSEFASVFYKKHLGPALDFRLNVGRQVFPTGTKLSQEVGRASDVLDDNLRMALADQLRRRLIFAKKMDEIYADLKERNKYRTWIVQLTPVGSKLPTSGPNVMEEGEDESAAEVEYFNREEEEAEEQEESPEEDAFTPLHGSLDGLDNPDAHPQYLLKAGGEMHGNIDLDKGILVDGMRPGTHRHTGKDGTPQIHGKDIIGGTISDDVIDTGNRPNGPTGLAVIGHDVITTPPGGTSINTHIKWDGDPTRYTYEVQVTRVVSGIFIS